MKKTKPLIIVFCVGLGLFLGYIVLVALKPSIIIVNGSVKPLKNITIKMSSNHEVWTENLSILLPNERIEVTKDASDLLIHSIEFWIGKEKYIWNEGGISTTGETLWLLIDSQGNISSSYISLPVSNPKSEKGTRN